MATNGLDTNTGTSNSPFATIMRAQTAASANDTVYLRGGTYYPDNSNLTATNSPWAIVNNITKNDISYLAYPGELPIFNFTNVQPRGQRVTAFHVTASRLCFPGIRCRRRASDDSDRPHAVGMFSNRRRKQQSF